ncbi:MAG: SCO family protein [Alphaproteobacteria bacterium]|nr:SCO family protein [Alphaproteobacteria bacterium]
MKGNWGKAVMFAAIVALLGVGGIIAGQVIYREVAGDGSTVPIGGDFTLVNQNGETVRDGDYRGKNMLVFFGYTHCPDFCPFSLDTIGGALDKMAPEKVNDLEVLFITVDPERDTVDVMKDYVGFFHPKIQGLTGSTEQVKAAARAYRIYYQKVEREEGPYLMDHSTYIYLMDENGHYVTHVTEDMGAEAIAERLSKNI